LGFWYMLVRRVRGAKLRPADRSIVSEGKPLGAALVGMLCAIFAAEAGAKTPGTVHCYGGWCHRVSTIDEMHAMVGQRGYLRASYYDDCRVDRFNACGLTSSGEVFRPDQADNAASPIFPDGTVLLAYNPENGNAAVLRVNSTGPYRGDRRLDVSRATAEKLGFQKKGVADLAVTVIKSPEPEDARYKKMRNYTRVPGYIGKFKNFDAAHDAAIAGVDLQLESTVAALDSGLDPAFSPPDQRAALASMPRVETVAIPVREIVFSSQPDGSARASEFSQLAPVAEPELLRQPLDVTLKDGPLPPGIMVSHDWQVVAAIDHAASIDQMGQLDSKVAGDGHDDNADVRGRFIKIGASFDGAIIGRINAFFDVARAEARLKGRRLAAWESASKLSWSERVQAFVHEARLKARASVAQDGVIQRFTAELTLKARRFR
jgi:rare lipoprotein A